MLSLSAYAKLVAATAVLLWLQVHQAGSGTPAAMPTAPAPTMPAPSTVPGTAHVPATSCPATTPPPLPALAPTAPAASESAGPSAAPNMSRSQPHHPAPMQQQPCGTSHPAAHAPADCSKRPAPETGSGLLGLPAIALQIIYNLLGARDRCLFPAICKAARAARLHEQLQKHTLSVPDQQATSPAGQQQHPLRELAARVAALLRGAPHLICLDLDLHALPHPAQPPSDGDVHELLRACRGLAELAVYAHPSVAVALAAQQAPCQVSWLNTTFEVSTFERSEAALAHDMAARNAAAAADIAARAAYKHAAGQAPGNGWRVYAVSGFAEDCSEVPPCAWPGVELAYIKLKQDPQFLQAANLQAAENLAARLAAVPQVELQSRIRQQAAPGQQAQALPPLLPGLAPLLRVATGLSDFYWDADAPQSPVSSALFAAVAAGAAPRCTGLHIQGRMLGAVPAPVRSRLLWMMLFFEVQPDLDSLLQLPPHYVPHLRRLFLVNETHGSPAAQQLVLAPAHASALVAAAPGLVELFVRGVDVPAAAKAELLRARPALKLFDSAAFASVESG